MTMQRRRFLLASSTLASGVFAPYVRAAVPCPPPLVIAGNNNVASPTCPVTTGSGSGLNSLAASMAAGTWAQLNASSLNVLGSVGSQGGVGGNMIPYSNQAVWDPITKAIRYCGNDHHG